MTENDFSSYNFKTRIRIRFSDIDAFGHVNNALYLTYFEIARTSYWKDVIKWDWNEAGIIIARAEVNFLAPIRMNDNVHAYVRTAKVGNKSFDLEYALVKNSGNGEILCTKGSTTCVAYDYSNQQTIPIPEIYRDKMQQFEFIDKG